MLTEQEVIRALPLAKGENKRELLLLLCDFRSETADAFWSERLKRPITQYLPYLCYSRSDAASDYAADLLEHAVNQMVIMKNQFSAEMTEKTWYALNLSFFKESPKLLAVCDRIGRHYKEIREMRLDWRALLNSGTLPPYLRRQANLAYAHSCSGNFIHLINDMMICTLVRSGGALYNAVEALAENYPEAFGYVGFFAAFVRDTAAAYDAYADVKHLEHILFTLHGLERQNDNTLCQYTPLWFYGVKNRIWHKKYDLPEIDSRWIDFLCSVHADASEAQREQISALLFQFTGLENKQQILQDYFFQAASEDTSECNLIGFMRCGGYDRTNELIQQICEMICVGKNNYHALFSVFDLLDLKKPEKLRLLSEAKDYIESTDNRASWYAQRNHFLHAVKLYREGWDSEFD